MASKKKDLMENCLRELRKNTETLESTFEKAGFQVIQQSWQLLDDDGSLACYVEVTGNPDQIQDKYITIKVNLYDSEGQILCMEHQAIGMDEFSGYETKQISFYDEGIVLKACKSRIFAVRGYQNS